VLSVGAIQPSKGFDFLIEAIGLLPNRIRPALRLVGNAEVNGVRAVLEAVALRHGVNLQIEIGVSQDTLVRRYNEAMLLAYVPHKEPFGLVPLEAMACGTPVVGVREGGILETVIDGVTGRLVNRSHDEFAAALTELLADPEKRRRLGEQGIAYVCERWAWNAAVANIERHLGAAAQAPRLVDNQVRHGD
jgi:glycosyltransferase involved in cell wall biosynthesis